MGKQRFGSFKTRTSVQGFFLLSLLVVNVSHSVENGRVDSKTALSEAGELTGTTFCYIVVFTIETLQVFTKTSTRTKTVASVERK